MMQPHSAARRRILPSLAIAVAVLAVVAAFSAGEPVAAVAAGRQYVVVIDAGHQARANNRLEPIGPGAKTRKPSVSSGTSGVRTHKAESQVNLAVALKLRDQLKARGVKVVMIRTKQNVNIPNSARARVANSAKADLFIRLHCDSAGSGTRGVLTLVPGTNKWTKPIVKSSANAGSAIHKAVLKSTGARSRGITKRTDMSGFNWSTRPCVIVEMGNMRNATDDKLLASSAYQTKLAKGVASGAMAYLSGK